MKSEVKRDRRDFLGTVVRGGILVSLASLGGILFSRKPGTGDCRTDFICSSCRAIDRCRLPEADQFRLERARKMNHSAHDGRKGK